MGSFSPNSYEVERIMEERLSEETGAPEFLVKWKGWPSEDSTWEPLEALDNCTAVLRVFRRSGGRIQPTRSSALSDGVPTPGSTSHKGYNRGAGAASPSSSSCRAAGASADPGASPANGDGKQQPERDTPASSEPPMQEKPRHAAAEKKPTAGAKRSQTAEADVKHAKKKPRASLADSGGGADHGPPPAREAPAAAAGASEAEEAARKAALKAEKKAAKLAAKAAKAEAMPVGGIGAAGEAAGNLAAKLAAKAAKAAAKAAPRAATVPETQAGRMSSPPAKKSPKSPPPASLESDRGGSAPKAKRRRCGECNGCLASNCNVCVNCVDMLANGGPGRCRLPCKDRKCTNLLPPKPPKPPKLPGSSAFPKPDGKSPDKPGSLWLKKPGRQWADGRVAAPTRQRTVAPPAPLKLVLPETLATPCPASGCRGTGAPVADAQHMLVCGACGGRWQSSWWFRYLTAAQQRTAPSVAEGNAPAP